MDEAGGFGEKGKTAAREGPTRTLLGQSKRRSGREFSWWERGLGRT